MTTPCPPSDHLARFLADDLPADDEARLSAHLDECPRCVQALEELTAPAAPATPATPPLTETLSLHADRPALPKTELSRLRDLLPLTAPVPYEAPPRAADLPDIPGYEVERELGRGGMGVVYLARQTQLNRRVALKMILAGRHAAQDQVIRFLAEAQTCAGLRHENIVPVYEVGRHDGMPFYAMEYVDGGTLADRVRHRPLTPREAARVVEQLARAMHVAHARGVIHRDLKPVNVLLRDPDPAGTGDTRTLSVGADDLVPLITDFGLAKHFESGDGLTVTGTILGTPDYMAPEQLVPGARVGPGVDVHALGAILYTLLAGRPPFTAAGPLETLDRVLNADPVPPSSVNPAVPRDLSVICTRCLQKTPGRRYASAEALADDLRRFLDGVPITARPVTDMERLWKWAGRNPTVAGLLATLAGVVLVALGLVSWQWYAAEAARGREADRANAEAAAKDAEAKTRRGAQVLSAGYALDQGILACRGGRLGPGLALMIDALELLPADEPELEYAIRANIGAWRDRRAPGVQGRHPHGTPVVSAAFSPDGKHVLVGSWANAMGQSGPAFAKLFDAARFAGEPVWSEEQKGPAWGVAFSPDGARVAIGGFDGTVSVRDAKTGALAFTLPHGGCVTSVAFSPDGQTLAVAGSNNLVYPLAGGGRLRFWNPGTGEARGEPIELPHCRVYGVSWHRDGQVLAVGGTDPDKADSGAAGVVAFYDVSRRAFRDPALPHADIVTAVAFHPAGEVLASGARDGLVRFWDYPSGRLQQTRSAGVFPSNVPKLLRHALPVTSLSFSRTGDMLATSSGHHDQGVRAGHGEVHVWETATGTRLMSPHFTPSPGQSQKMHAVAFGDNDRKLAAACEHGHPWLWHLPPPPLPRDLPTTARTDLIHSPDGRTLLLALMPERVRGFNDMPCEIHILNVADGRVVRRLPHPAMVRVRFRPDSTRFVTLTGAAVWLWDAAAGDEVKLPDGFGPKVQEVQFTADGKTILTIAGDGAFRGWDAATLAPRDDPRPCVQPGEGVLAFDDAGTRLLIHCAEGARLVSLPDCRTIAVLDRGPLVGSTPGDGRPGMMGAFTADGRTVVTTVADAADPVRRWQAQDGQRLPTNGTGGNWVVSARHPDGVRFLLTETRGTTSRLWNAATGELSPIPIPVHGIITIHPGGRLIAATQANTADHCQLWGLAGKPIGPPFPHALLNDVQFHPGGRGLVTSSNDKTVKVWPLPTPAAGTPAELRAALEMP